MLAVFLVIVAVVAWYAHKQIKARRAPVVSYWTYLEYLHFPTPIVQEAVRRCFGEGERFVQGSSTIHLYTRGDARIRQVSSARGVRLNDIPSTFCVGVDAERGKTLVSMRIEIDRRQVEISWSVAKGFDGAAKAEFEDAVRRLHEATVQLLAERDAQQRRSQYEFREPVVESSNQADYAALGLKPGATPEQVHAAYRDACRKYHPDRLTGLNVEPHLVELAVQRFKEISAAYQRLKEQLARPQHA